MSDLKLTADDSAVIAALDNIEKKLAQVGTKADETGKKLGASFTESEADAKRAADSLAAYTAAQEKLKAGAQERIAKNAQLRASLEQFRKEQAALNAATEEGAKKNVEMASSLKDTSGSLANAANAAKSAEGATKGATVAQRLFNLVMSANPIGLIIAALALLVNQLRKYQGAIDFASKITAQIGAVITVVTDRVISLGKAIYSLITLDYASFGKNSVDAFVGFGDAVTNAWTQAGNLADATVALRDAQLAAALSTAKLQAASEKAIAASQDETRNFNDRIAQLKKGIALEAEIARIKVGFAEQDAANARTAFALSNQNVAEKEALLEKELALQETRNGADKNRIQLLQQLNALEKQRTEFIAKNLEDVAKLIDKLDVSLADDPTDKKIEQINQSVEAQVKEIEKGIAKIAEVQKLRPLNDDEIAQRQNLQDKIVQVIDQGEKDILNAILDGARKQAEAQDKIDKAKKEAEKKKGEDARKALKDILDLENAKIDITQAEFGNFIATLKAQGADEEVVKTAQLEFDKRVKAERLQAELDYQKSLLALIEAGPEKDIIQARIQEIQTLLEGIDIPAPKKKPGDTNLFDLLGINLPPEQEEAIRKAVGSIIDSLGQLAQARIDEAQAATDAAQEKLDAAEDALKEEESLAKQGFANNVDLKKKEVAEAKKIRDDAAKEEIKAKRAAIALDTAVQLSGLITSSVNIFKSLSPLGPIGVGLAIATIGLMFGAFAASKASALKATAPPKLRKGRKFDGPTHEQGNEDLVFDGRQAYAVEKDEWLIGTEHSREHDTFLHNMNRGKYKGMNLAAMAEGKGDYQSPLNEAAPRIERLGKRKEAAQEAQHFNVLAKTYERVGDRIVGAISEKPDIYPWKGGYKEVKKGGSVTTKKTVLPEGE